MTKDVFDYIDDEGAAHHAPRRSGVVWNVLAILVLFAACLFVYVFVTIFNNPTTFLNPFPPPTIPALVPTNTPTPTPRVILPPTWTPTPTLPPTDTPTPEPTATELVVEQPADQGEGNQGAPAEGMPFVMQEGSPQPINGANFHPDLGCNWMGVAGGVIDLSGAPVPSIILRLGGTLNGKQVEELGISGMSPSYGQAGYEFTLADKPIKSTQALWLQLLDQAGLPLSDKIYFDTYEDCEQNLILIYFKQVK
jgi:hypothetical protein